MSVQPTDDASAMTAPRAGRAAIPPDIQRHARIAKWLLLPYLASLATFWYQLVVVGHDSTPVTVFLWVGLVAYLALIAECTVIQERLYQQGLQKSRGWQVAVGGLLLNPCFVGWWIPLSVLLSVRRASVRRAR